MRYFFRFKPNTTLRHSIMAVIADSEYDASLMMERLYSGMYLPMPKESAAKSTYAHTRNFTENWLDYGTPCDFFDEKTYETIELADPDGGELDVEIKDIKNTSAADYQKPYKFIEDYNPDGKDDGNGGGNEADETEKNQRTYNKRPNYTKSTHDFIVSDDYYDVSCVIKNQAITEPIYTLEIKNTGTSNAIRDVRIRTLSFGYRDDSFVDFSPKSLSIATHNEEYFVKLPSRRDIFYGNAILSDQHPYTWEMLGEPSTSGTFDENYQGLTLPACICITRTGDNNPTWMNVFPRNFLTSYIYVAVFYEPLGKWVVHSPFVTHKSNVESLSLNKQSELSTLLFDTRTPFWKQQLDKAPEIYLPGDLFLLNEAPSSTRNTWVDFGKRFSEEVNLEGISSNKALLIKLSTDDVTETNELIRVDETSISLSGAQVKFKLKTNVSSSMTFNYGRYKATLRIDKEGIPKYQTEMEINPEDYFELKSVTMSVSGKDCDAAFFRISCSEAPSENCLNIADIELYGVA